MGLVSGVVWPVPADGHRGECSVLPCASVPCHPSQESLREAASLPLCSPLLMGAQNLTQKLTQVTEVEWTDPDLASLVPSFPAPSDLALPSTSHPIKTSLDPRPSF